MTNHPKLTESHDSAARWWRELMFRLRCPNLGAIHFYPERTMFGVPPWSITDSIASSTVQCKRLRWHRGDCDYPYIGSAGK